jgi:hypothetical protein
MNPEIIQQWRGTQVFLTDGQMNHRAAAIQTACDLESQLSELLSAVFINNKPQLDGLNEQAVLMCIKAQLMFDLRQRLKAVGAPSQLTSSGEKNA